jgi:putative NADH-flavin reductase
MKEKKIFLIGANGRTGHYVLDELLSRGYKNSNITALIRQPEQKERFDRMNITTVLTDARDPEIMKATLKDKHIVINCMSSDSYVRPTEKEVTENILNHIGKDTIYVIVSTLGINESFKTLPLLSKIVFQTLFRNVAKDKVAIEDKVKTSGKRYIILRPGLLTDKDNNAVTVVKPAPSSMFGRINRKKLAKVIVDLMENPDSYNTTWEAVDVI